MKSQHELDSYYDKYINNINEWLPDGLFEVDLDLLQRLDLLGNNKNEEHTSALTRYFHAVESNGRLTLINEHFVIWIVPGKVDSSPVTYTLIALNKNDNIDLQLGFINKGVYNSSHIVLQVLEKYLYEIQEIEDTLNKFA